MSTSVATTRTPVSTQCEYESRNTTTNCWNYRSCATCLQTKGCMIGSSGACQTIEWATSQHNYTRAFAFNLILPAARDTMNDSMKRVTQEWQFPAFEATYCKRDDVVCQQCIQDEFWYRNYGRDSRFCVGKDSCVCVMNCEFTVLNPACGEAYVPTETALPPMVVLPSPTTVDKVPVTECDCRFTTNASATGCSTYRTCRDCLATTGCRVGIYGRCELDKPHVGSNELDYAIAIARNLTLPTARYLNASTRTTQQEWEFPASQLQYCPANDTVCSECVRESFWLDPGISTDSRFCSSTTTSRGVAKPCVCISNCAFYDARTSCPTSSNDRDQQSSMDGWVRFGNALLAGVLTLALLAVAAVCCCLSACRKFNAMEEQSAQAPVARVVASAAMYVVVQLPTQGNASRT